MKRLRLFLRHFLADEFRVLADRLDPGVNLVVGHGDPARQARSVALALRLSR